MKIFRCLTLAIAFMSPAFGSLQAGTDIPIDEFFGSYKGSSISENGEGLSARDIGVVIRARERGFTLAWSTITHKANGKTKNKQYSIDFTSTGRKSIYASAMKTNKFGARVPLDPLKGEPYVWARIEDNTLTVYALLITDEGDYEMQTYNRTLTRDGMELEFLRIFDGKKLKRITGSLTRTGD